MDKNNKLFRIISFSLLGLSALMSIYFFSTDFNDLDATSSVAGIFLTLCYIFLGIGALAAVVFPLITMAQNPKGAKNALIGVVGLIVICVIGYVMAGNEVHANLEGVVLADAATSQKSEAGLIAFYILGAGAIGSIIYAEVSKMIK